jgi:hypothetical protein
MFLGIAAMEYASLKPAILICPTVLICVSLRGAPGAVLRNILQRTQEMCVMAVPFVALAHPVLINTWNGGTALFEGRRAVMVGGAFFNYSKERLPVTYHSVLGYLRQLFLSGADFPPLVYSGIPQRPGLLTSIDTFLFMAAVVMWIVSCQQWLRSSRASRAALSGPVVRGGLWFFWTLLLLLYCSYFNPVVFSRRILVCVPLLLLFVGEGMALFLQRFPQRRLLLRTGILCVAVGALLYNGSSLHASLHSADFIGAFRSKTSAICAELSTRDASEKYLVGFDWPSDSVWYLGDTPIREWIKDTSRSGYDSWPCIRPSIFTAAVALEAGSNLAVLKALRQSPATYLLLMTRATAPSEINYPGSVSQSLLSRLQVRVDALRADILLEDCKYVPDSAWYLSAVCRIGGDHMRASSVAPE